MFHTHVLRRFDSGLRIDMVVLFHGGHEVLDFIEPDEGLGGLFCSPSLEAAKSHGPIVHVFELDDDEVLTNYALNYDIDDDELNMAFEQVCGEDDLWGAVVSDDNVFDSDLAPKDFGFDDMADLSWGCQRYRCRLAAALGYAAVEMSDEHGISYCVNELADGPYPL